MYTFCDLYVVQACFAVLFLHRSNLIITDLCPIISQPALHFLCHSIGFCAIVTKYTRAVYCTRVRGQCKNVCVKFSVQLKKICQLVFNTGHRLIAINTIIITVVILL